MRAASVAGAVVLATSACSQEDRADPPVAPSTTVATAAAAQATATAGWRDLGSPLSARVGEVVAWSGEDLLVWGGFVPQHLDLSEPPRGDGALYDLAADRWTPLPPSPLAAGGGAAVWTGDVFVVVRSGPPSDGPPAATFGPATMSWQSIDGEPVEALAGAAWTGREVIVQPGNRAWDPGRQTWRALPPRPGSAEPSDVVWTGDRLVVAGASSVPSASGWSLVAYDPVENRWHHLPEPPFPTDGMAGTGWSGRELVVVGWSRQAAALDPVRMTWSALPSLPGHQVKCRPGITMAGTDLLAGLCGFSATLSPGSSYLEPVRSPRAVAFSVTTPLVSTGSEVLAATYGFTPGDRPALGPAPLGDALLIDPAARPSSFAVDGIGITAVVEAAGAPPCTLAAWPADDAPSSSGRTAQLGVAHGATTDVVWSTIRDHVTAVHANAFGTWQVTCPDEAAVRVVGRHLSVRGDRTTPVDATSEVVAAARASASAVAEQGELTDRLASALGRQLSEARGVGLVTGLGVPPAGRDALIELYGDLSDQRLGVVYAVRYAPDAVTGWVVAQAERQDVCQQGLADANTCA
jgi:hypothetical protein